MEAWALPPDAATGGTLAASGGGRAAALSARGLRAATDARLVALVRDGHPLAFEVIYERYHRPILAFCRHLLGDREDAADAAQHTFLAAYNAIVSSERSILLRAWLFTIARNRCYSLLRAARQRALAEVEEWISEGPATEVLRREDLRALVGDLRRLPDDQRAALVLAELANLSHQEIARLLGVRPGKVKALVFQARESLGAMRQARETNCREIRSQLRVAEGAALRRGPLRRHLHGCPACRQFYERQRRRRALARRLPVPS